MDERDDREDWVELTQHVHSMHGIPDDARLMGLDRNTEEGAMVAMAGSLSAAKRSHRIVAWMVLVSLVGPAFYSIVHAVF